MLLIREASGGTDKYRKLRVRRNTGLALGVIGGFLCQKKKKKKKFSYIGKQLGGHICQR
jgi:hypothetical protein